MFDGMQRRIVSMWFPRLPCDRAMRLDPVDGPFALTLRQNNTVRIHDLNRQAEGHGLHRGMPFSEARAYCATLRARSADPLAEARFLAGLRRWALRYCPWVGIEDAEGLVLDITGAAHLHGGEQALLDDMRARLDRTGIEVRLGLADSRAAAWALAHHDQGIAPPGDVMAAMADLPVVALRLDPPIVTALQRLGLRHVGALAAAPRAPLARRFGQGLLTRLDQALCRQSEPIMPWAEPPHYAVRLTLPEPIGLISDVMAGLDRLLQGLCARLKAHEAGARSLCLTLRRVDRNSQIVPLRLAAAMRDPARILPLFARAVEKVDAGFGIDQLRLQATVVEPLPLQQIGRETDTPEQLDNLITRIGTRIGLENVLCFQPVDSHIPERSFRLVPLALAQPAAGWSLDRPRPLRLFSPEAIAGRGATPPKSFRWRRMALTTARATGPERIAREWWVGDDDWHFGIRDYWRVQTEQGRRLWLFHTPQNPGWFVQGEFA